MRIPRAVSRELDPAADPEVVGWVWLRPLAAGLAAAAVAYVAGLALAASIGLAGDYLRARLVYLGVFGVVWSVAWFLWSVANVPQMLLGSRVAFAAPRASFDAQFRRWSAELRRTPTWWLLLWFAVPAGYVVAGTQLLVPEDRPLWGLPEFGEVWLEGDDLLVKNLVAVVWAAAFALAVAPNLAGAWKYLRIVASIARGSALPLAESPVIAREGLRRVALFGLIGSFAWTVAGASWGFVVAYDHFSWHELVPAVVLSAMAVVLLFFPQLVFRRTLVRLRLARLRQLVSDEGQPLHDVEDRVRSLQQDAVLPHGGLVAALIVLVVQVGVPAASVVVSARID